MAKSIGFHCKAGKETGLGHVVRCLALASELRLRGHHCTFVGNHDALVRAAFEGHAVADGFARQDVWVADLEGGVPPSLALELRGLCDTLVILNGVGYPDGDEGRLVADLVVYQGCTERPYALPWDGFKGEWLEGPDWVILRPGLREGRRLRTREADDRPRVLAAGGGADRFCVAAIASRTLYSWCDVTAVIGPYASPANWPDRVHLEVCPADPAPLVEWADLAVISYGMTAFECLCSGLPVVALSISEDHAASAALVERRSGGALVDLGVVPADETDALWAIWNATVAVLNDLEGRSQRALDFVDGLGARRVAEKIEEAIDGK